MRTLRLIKNNYICGLMVAAALTGCEKDSKVERPSLHFSPAPENIVAMRGDTFVCKRMEPLRLLISGDADMLVYYSGKQGADYRYKDRTEILDALPSLSFTAQVQYGAAPTSLKIYLSDSFPGLTMDPETDRANILEGGYWTEITGDCNLPDKASSTANSRVTTGIDLSAYKKGICHVALRVVCPLSVKSSTWTVSGMKVENKVDNFTSLIAATGSMGWKAFDCNATENHYRADGGTNQPGSNLGWNIASANSGDNIKCGASTNNVVAYDDWLISDNLSLTKAVPDRGVAIKGFVDAPVNEIAEIYDREGVYHVTLAAVNSKYDVSRESVTSFILKIEE